MLSILIAVPFTNSGCFDRMENVPPSAHGMFHSRTKREVVVYDVECGGKELWRFTGIVNVAEDSLINCTAFLYIGKNGELKRAEFVGNGIKFSFRDVDE